MVSQHPGIQGASGYLAPCTRINSAREVNSLCRLRIGAASSLVRLGSSVSFRKEVIQPHLPVRLPCYDLAPIAEFTFGRSLLAVRTRTSGTPDFRGLTGGVYKARERIHRCLLISDY